MPIPMHPLFRTYRVTPVILTAVLINALHASAGLFDDLPGLSTAARSALVAHYDGRAGVATTGSVVESWIPVDGDGMPLPDMVTSSTQRGSGAPDLITYDGSDRLIFDDTSTGADGRYLSGNLANAGSTDFTIFWLGHYKNSAPFANAGSYAYNIGPSDISHQRDDGGGGFRVEMYNGTTYAGDDITAFDGTDTVWSTVITASTHDAYADGSNLNLGGSPANSVAANAAIVIGAFSSGGYDLVGEIRQIIIFESALGDDDRGLVEAYLGDLAGLPPQPGPTPLLPPEFTIDDGIVELTWNADAHLLSSSDLDEWFIEAEATSPMSWEIDKEREFFRLVTEFTEIPSGAVVRTRFSSDTWREIEYHLDTGDLFFVGEQAHGLDFYGSSNNDLWWCGMNTSSHGSGLLEFLMDHDANAAATKAAAIAGGWTTYTAPNYSFLTFDPLPSQKTYVNDTAPAISGQTDTTEAYTPDYDELDSSQLLLAIYRNSSNGAVYAGLGGPSLNSLISPQPPGDGTSNRDNGVRYDIAFKTNLTLSTEDKLELLNRFPPVKPIYGDDSGAYSYIHPPGL
jgi:hypothetical protein